MAGAAHEAMVWAWATGRPIPSFTSGGVVKQSRRRQGKSRPQRCVVSVADILLHRIVDVAERAHPVLHHRPNEKARKPIVGNIGSAREQERTN
jgi:hypothetical protein